ncbi:peptide-methionine (S)-S-oxide reductase MsrA [Arsenicicoccus dermatophilus]|uniref:peptide-methionine (S)-S-oxide reductase MsrA n=1 Tax=Arsenicicoccus dermatophilus TaxID=1076331 RepID=UPI0039170C23
MIFGRPEPVMVTADQALPGRPDPMPGLAARHTVLDAPLTGPWTTSSGHPAEVIHLAGGCFWGLERILWQVPGVVGTAVGYMGGFTPHPTYEETCTGRTGHTETVLVAYDPAVVGADRLVATLLENHDPTTADRQGNDVGTQYRSAIYWTTDLQGAQARAACEAFDRLLTSRGHGHVTTELRPAAEAGPFYFAEDYHQQYLHKNPGGYCNHGPNGYSCPVGLVSAADLPAQTDVAPPARTDVAQTDVRPPR